MSVTFHLPPSCHPFRSIGEQQQQRSSRETTPLSLWSTSCFFVVGTCRHLVTTVVRTHHRSQVSETSLSITILHGVLKRVSSLPRCAVTISPFTVDMPDIALILRPQNQGGWSMGEDATIAVEESLTLHELRLRVASLRPHISPHRVRFRYSNQKAVPDHLYDWSLGRHGFHDGYVLIVEPTFNCGWLWNPEQHYMDKLLDQVETLILCEDAKQMTLSDLSKRVAMPPFMKYSLRTLLRQFPERFQLTVNTTRGIILCRLATENCRIPRWHESSIEAIALRPDA